MHQSPEAFLSLTQSHNLKNISCDKDRNAKIKKTQYLE